jgi:DNA polymerase-3 subunit beta
MKLVVIRSHLREALGAIIGATIENSTLPILKNICIDAKEGKIVLSATNLEIAFEYSLLGKVLEPGKTTIPATMLANILGNLESERINLETKQTNLEITTDNYQATLQCASPDEFPLIPKIKTPTGTITIKGALLKDAVSKVLFCAQASELRPELGSVLVSFSIDSLKLVATDSFRLAEKTVGSDEFSTTHKDEFKILVPLKTAQELYRTIRTEEEVIISHDESQIAFETPTLLLVSRLIDGKFPDYEAIFPKKFTTELSLEKGEFLSAVKLAGSLGVRSGEVKLKTLENKKSVLFSSVEQGVGENSYALPARMQGDLKEISFNWKYLWEGAKALDGDEVYIGLVEENKAALIKSPGDASYFYILMPILKA